MLNRFRRGLIVSAIIIVGSFLISGVVLYLMAGDLRFQVQNIGEAQAAILNSRIVLDSLSALKEDLAQASDYSQAMDKILVPQDQLLDFGKWLDQLARAYQIQLNFSFGGEPVSPQAGSPGYYNFSLELNGDLNNIMDFVKDVEYRSPRFLTVFDSLDLSNKDGSYEVSANGRVFFK